ncbi:MAG TPA: hypothetical protein PK059_02065 [Cyclobacteriaceae bacterium]|nr:hypothetical protein [Cyclobacteriaceae bacterium]
MATLTRTSPSATANGNWNAGAADASMTAVAASDSVTNADGRTFLWVSNQGGSTDTITIPVQNATQYSASGVPLTPSAITVAVATTERRLIGPISPSVYNDSGGNITIQHSFTTSVKILALAIPSF